MTRAEAVLQELRVNDGSTSADIGLALKLPTNEVNTYLRALERRGLVEIKGRRHNGPYHPSWVWWVK